MFAGAGRFVSKRTEFLGANSEKKSPFKLLKRQIYEHGAIRKTRCAPKAEPRERAVSHLQGLWRPEPSFLTLSISINAAVRLMSTYLVPPA